MSERRTVADMLREARSRIEELSVEELQAEIEAGAAVLTNLLVN